MASQDADNFQQILLSCAERFGAVTQKNFQNFFAATSTKEDSAIWKDGIQTNHQFLISIFFTGSVYGEYVLALEENVAASLMNVPRPASGPELTAWREDASDTFREVLNVIVGESISLLSEHYQKLTITAPRIYFGHILYPRVRTGRTCLKYSAGEIECFLYVDRMKLDLASSYKEALSSLTVAHEELQKAMGKLQEQQALLVQTEKMAALGTMAAGVAHEINTPLATVSLVTDQIKELLGPPEERKDLLTMLDLIDKTVSHMAHITTGLRTFARGMQGEDFQITPLQDIFENTLALCKSYLIEKKVKLICDPISPQLTLNCRASQLTQVFLNLIRNASDAIDQQSEKWIRIEVKNQSDVCELRFVDSGSGIPEEVQKKMFDPFFTTKGIGKGTGLGLSISKGILNDHRATIEIDNTSKNTCFLIRIPKQVKNVKSA